MSGVSFEMGAPPTEMVVDNVVHDPQQEISAIINSNAPAQKPTQQTQIQVASGHPLGVIAFGVTTFLFGLILSHADSMWFKTIITAGAANTIAAGEHQATTALALLLQWFSMGALFIAGVQQTLNNDQTGAASYFFNGMGLGAIGYMFGSGAISTNAIGYVFYALFYFNTLVTGAHFCGNSDVAGTYKTAFTVLFGALALFCLFAGLRFTEASYDETNLADSASNKYDKTGDMLAGVTALITSFICALLAIPLLVGKSLGLGVSLKVK